MPLPLKVLIVEDNPLDAEMELLALQDAGFKVDWERVETEAAFLARLDPKLDLVLSDFSLPKFNGLRALELLQQSALDIPFILVSGTVGEDIAVDALQKGAADYLLKDRMVRLGPAVTHALAETRLRRERRQADETLRIAQSQLGQLLEHSPVVIYLIKLAGGKPIPHLVSDSIVTLLGFTVAEASTHEWWLAQLHPDDQARAVQSVTETMETGASRTEYRLRHKDGRYHWVEDTRRLIRDAVGAPVELIGVWADISEHKRAEEIARQASGDLAQDQRKQARMELAVLVVATAAVFLLAAHFNWFESATRWILQYAADELDEVILTAIFFMVGLGVFAVRRWRETESELTSHHQARAALALLHDELDRQAKQRTAELAATNRTLSEAEHKYRSIYENSSEGIFQNTAEGRLISANPALARMLGFASPEEMIRQRTDLEEQGYSDPAQRDSFKRRLQERGFINGYEYEIRRKDDAMIWVSENVRIVRATAGHAEYYEGSMQDITARKLAEHALRESESTMAAAQHIGHFGSWEVRFIEAQNEDANQLQWSDEMFRIAGYEPGAVTITNQFFFSRIPPEDRELIRSGMAAAIRERQPYSLVHRLIRADGRVCILQEHAKIFFDENTGRPLRIIGTAHDITERKQAEDALGESEKRFKALFEQAAVGVAVTDCMTMRLVQVNQRFADMLGRNRADVEQLTIAAITHPEEIGHDAVAMQQLRAGDIREFTRDKRYLRKDGTEVWANLTVSAMWAPGEAPGLCIAVVLDITERKTMEEQFRQAQKMEAIGTLAGGIAHDFNNILAAINGYTELSRMALHGNPEVRDYLGAVLQATSRAAGLVRQILTFSRRQPVDRQPVQLRPTVEEALKLLRASIPSSIEFDLTFATDAPVVLADPTQIHQILMNLGTNAWHAMQDRTGRLAVKLERFEVDAALAATTPNLRPGLYARLSVSDTGSGMDAATLGRMFEPFFTTKAPGEGTGLGLAVVHGIMASHDGAVTVSSQPGAGTVFRLYFPADTGQAPMAAVEEASAPSGHGEWILLVDDEEVLTRLGRKMLEALGYNVEATTLPGTALALVRADPWRFALVLTDQTMPGMTGLELARELRQLRAELPILLMTGFGAVVTRERLAEAGISQLLSKPTSINSLGAAVQAALSGPTPILHGAHTPD